jgi:hypothetical protein
MPSGHAQNAVSIWGLTAYLIHKRWAVALAAGVCLFIGISRAYLGAHLLGDVLVGWAAGAVFLGLFIRAMPVLEERIGRMDLKGQIALAFLASLAIILLYLLGRASVAGWQVPPAWEANALRAGGEAIAPFSPVDALLAAGMVLGVSSGYAILKRWGGFRVDGLSRRLVCYLLGMAGVVLIWHALREAQVHAVGWIINYIMITLAGLWVTLGAPLIFIRLGLAEREEPADR